MLNKMTAIVLCAVLSFCMMSLTSSVKADDVEETVTGKVIDVDLDEQSVVIGDADRDIVVYIENDTQIQQGDEKKSINDLKVGNIVKVNYKKSGDDLIARSIMII